MGPAELPDDRLATTAKDGSRVYLYPADVRGRWRAARDRVYDVLLIVFLVMPWIRIGGKPLLLLDIPTRRFTILGFSFWGHDAPILFLVFGVFAVLIGWVTAVWGRGWCGWACPQTVFIDRVYGRIERWIDGDSIARRRWDAQPMSPAKFARRAVKWSLFAAASLGVTHSFLAYFTGTERLARMVTRPPAENWTAFVVMAATTAIVLFDFGWFREQFCVIVCPYGRLQSVLMDEHSRIVAYDSKRGEPRVVPGANRNDSGDCVNCTRCVQVCPTGIDIRRGVQMECVACTACIDACDEVMRKIKKPEGLIRYDTEAGLAGRKTRELRPRTMIYGTALVVFVTALTLVLWLREPLKVSVVRSAETPYQVIPERDEIINHFKVNIRNQNGRDGWVDFEPDGEWSGEFGVVMPVTPLRVPAGKSARADLFVTFAAARLRAGRSEAAMSVNADFGGGRRRVSTERVPLVGPEST